MTLNDSLNSHSSFSLEGYFWWKDKMRIFIEEMDYNIWKVDKYGLLFPHIKLMVLW